MDHLCKYSRAGNEGGGGEGAQALLVGGDPGQPLVASTPACGVTVHERWIESVVLVRGWVCGWTLADPALHVSPALTSALLPESHFLSDSWRAETASASLLHHQRIRNRTSWPCSS